MKKKITTALSVIALLSGCSSNGQPSAFTEDITRKALALNSENVCEALTGSSQRDYCLKLLRDSRTIGRAANEGKIELCSELSSPDAKKVCEAASSAEKVKREKEEKEKNQLMALQNGNSVKDCEKLKEESMKDQCIMNVASGLAFEQRKPELCKPIREKEVREICELFAQ
jgi:hypothetical protein